MPWKINKSGDKKYQVSMYAKEELPTWAEIYEEFYQKKSFVYDPKNKDHQELDLYWKIPKRKYILATVCNQFNKMIFEDGFKDDMIAMINKDIVSDCCDIRFSCEPIENFDPSGMHDDDIQTNYDTFVDSWKNAIDSQFVGRHEAPPIYNIPLPSGEDNPFITSKHPRTNINTISTPLCLFPIIKLHNTGSEYSIFTPLPFKSDSCEDYNMIIAFMMSQFKDYFEGSDIGWKNSDGTVIESDPMKRSCDGAGYDPAL